MKKLILFVLLTALLLVPGSAQAKPVASNADVCISIWSPTPLNIVPAPTIVNYQALTIGYYNTGAIIHVQEVLENSEGQWARVNDHQYTPTFIPGIRTFAMQVTCP